MWAKHMRKENFLGFCVKIFLKALHNFASTLQLIEYFP